MDKLGNYACSSKNAIYMYKDSVEIPPLGMVDDALIISTCGTESVKTNSVINSFIESKKLKFGKSKCHRMHIGKSDKNCPSLKVHGFQMDGSKCEKYLGDLISADGKITDNIAARKNKGFGLSDGIVAILDEIPLGRFKIEMGLELRQAMLINGILYNSEAWQSISDDEFKQLDLIDNHILRKILGAHSKTSTSFLHLETGTIPIRFVIANRRLVFYYNIMSKPGSELIKRVFNAQKDNPTKGDWYHTIKSEFELIMEDIGDYDEQTIKSMKFSSYKKFIKKRSEKQH